jgi:hypothetical protein
MLFRAVFIFFFIVVLVALVAGLISKPKWSKPDEDSHDEDEA